MEFKAFIVIEPEDVKELANGHELTISIGGIPVQIVASDALREEYQRIIEEENAKLRAAARGIKPLTELEV
jgi:hypothetical protein